MTQLKITREALRKPSQKRRKSCPFAAPNTPEIDYKDLKVLTRYVSERGKIIPSRISAVSSKNSLLGIVKLPLLVLSVAISSFTEITSPTRTDPSRKWNCFFIIF